MTQRRQSMRPALRPEATALLRRWRETLIGGAVIALGLYWVVFSFGLMVWIGWIVATAGVALAVAGIQRARFRAAEDGPGVVRVLEGRIAYMGPLDGGTADLETLRALRLDPTGLPAHWILDRPDQPPLAIPVTAQGADALFDAFASLPGMRTEHMLRSLNAPGGASVIVWRASDATQKRLH
ncbi:hypothetical protein [Citreimonas salinaria]|uniref:Uncharacterized protein n=1 Tax=Citreimonas salinaria TaxID=321339 RepID=A0A1H3M886_9RHOB|nr:hypothetical protein [Citreimonas salinaria]SDY72930.1 hypothetical protein SAMN05444340_11622 [Citreimonas salinaria]